MRIRFVGGPFDGHRQGVDVARLIKRVCLPVSRTVFDMFDNRNPVGPQAPTTSIAVYDREDWATENEWRYIFVEAQSPRDYKPVKII